MYHVMEHEVARGNAGISESSIADNTINGQSRWQYQISLPRGADWRLGLIKKTM